MARILIFILCLICCFSLQAQLNGIYVGIGAHATFQKPDNLNFVLDRYNNTRTDCSTFCITDKMPHLNFTSGPAFNLGFVSNNFVSEINWLGRKNKISAQGEYPNGDVATRQLRFRMHSVGLGIGGIFGEYRVSIMPMITLDVGNHRVDTRAVQVGDVKEAEFLKIQKIINIGTSLSTSIFFYLGSNSNMALMIRPEYQFWGFNSNYATLNENINSNTAGGDSNELNARLSNFGLWLSLIAILGD